MTAPTPKEIHAHLAAGGLIERQSVNAVHRSDRFPQIACRLWLSFPDEPFANYRLGAES